jgi:hypothetical protein
VYSISSPLFFARFVPPTTHPKEVIPGFNVELLIIDMRCEDEGRFAHLSVPPPASSTSSS